MILVDDQAGSKDLHPYIKKLTPDVIMTRMDPPYGDVAWTGNGPNNRAITVGVEYKTIDDLLTCIGDGRFVAHQLPGLLETYDRTYLVVEGRLRPDRNTGILQKLRGERWCDIAKGGRYFTYADLEHWYNSIEEQAQVRVVKTYDEWETARWVVARHSWYQKEWEAHAALKQFHVPPPPGALFIKPSFLRRVAKEFPEIGWDRSQPVAAYFGNVFRMVTAAAEEWAKIVVGEDKNGHQLTIGRNRAQKIYNALRGINGQ